MTTSGETKAGWGALAKGAIGAAALAVAGFVGTVFTNVLSAPKDTVAYDLVQSITGLLRSGEAPPQAPATPERAAPAPSDRAAAPPQVERKAEVASPAPKVGLPSAADVAPPKPALPPSTSMSAGPPPSTGDAPAGSMLDRARQLNADLEKTRVKTAALAAGRVMTLADSSETPICGKTWRVAVTSVAAGRGEVSLRGGGESAPVTLSMGAPREVAADCRVELLLAYEDLTTRRAQLRETRTR
ncbi:hypothetical protein [Methylopila turkensis]|uniref:Uncharacterized protein n=1 Tax=Methylopila turkensis TaxID=1437816 RepID=A0A9W6JM17_9HYPH|nr:hypothetical protein [Methylopila turkensis]GLK79652.1 hypothetical protein GCM10008174_13930 [Methylopila turkensis]